MYLPNKYSGNKLPKASDLAEKYKWNNLIKCQALGHSPVRRMNELFDRIPSDKQPRATPIRTINPEHVTANNTTTDFKMGARFTARYS
jgi:hypothetical protein